MPTQLLPSNPPPTPSPHPPSPSNSHRATLSATAMPTATGEWEIMCITPGQGNGWNFPPSVLRDSLSLWNGIECYVDHAWSGQSLRDLCGVVYNPTYDGGIRATLRATGPSADIARELAREMLSDADPKPSVGFSADVVFTADDQLVTRIVHVYSLDLVTDPARGGAFIRALNQRQQGASPMSDNPTPATVAPNPEVEAVRSLLAVQQEQAAVAAEMEKAKAVRQQMCTYLLDAGLSASKLPAAMQANLRKQFSNRVFEATELNDAIEAARTLVSDLTASRTVNGLTVAREMFDSRDQLQAAVDDLMEVEREPAAKNLSVARLSGIRELYHGLTGDLDFHGGYDATHAKFQHTTTTFAGLVKNAMNKALVERWNQLGKAGYDWWKRIATVEHFNSINSVTWMIFGTVGSLPSITEGAEYVELKIGDSPETSSFTKYGGYVGVTLEALDRDDTRKLRAIPRELAAAAMRNISSQVAAIFSANTYVGPTLADTGALFNSTAVTTAGGHANLTSTALGSDYTAWAAAALAIYNQPMLIAQESGYYGTGAKMAIEPSILLHCRTLKSAAEALFIPRWASAPYLGASVPTSGAMSWGGRVEPICVPEWTSTTAWFAVVDPALVPSVMIGERFGLMPEIFIAGDEQSPAAFANDESRIKVRHFLTVGVADFRPLNRGNA